MFNFLWGEKVHPPRNRSYALRRTRVESARVSQKMRARNRCDRPLRRKKDGHGERTSLSVLPNMLYPKIGCPRQRLPSSKKMNTPTTFHEAMKSTSKRNGFTPRNAHSHGATREVTDDIILPSRSRGVPAVSRVLLCAPHGFHAEGIKVFRSPFLASVPIQVRDDRVTFRPKTQIEKADRADIKQGRPSCLLIEPSVPSVGRERFFRVLLSGTVVTSYS